MLCDWPINLPIRSKTSNKFIDININISLYLQNQLRYLVDSAIRYPEQLARERQPKASKT